MSLKEKVNFFKEEMSTEEKFFEGFFKLEKLWGKYKVLIIAGVVVVALAFIWVTANDYLKTQNKIKSNIAFNTLLENPTDPQAIATLKSINIELFEISQYLINRDSKINIEYLDTIANFNLAVKNNDIEAINKITLDSKFLLKDYAIFQKALMQALNKNYTQAKETLKLIPISSEVSKLSNKLSHYLLTK